MLRKRSRSHHKDQHMNHLVGDCISESCFHSDISSQKYKIHNSLLKMPGLFVGFNPRSSDTDSVLSPTSPLDFRVFSSFGNPFRHNRIQNAGENKRWNFEKVGLSIIESLKDENNEPGKVGRSSNNKNILLERNLSSQEALKLLPKDTAFFPEKQIGAEFGSSSVLFETGKSPFGPDSEIEDSDECGSYLTDFGSNKSMFESGNLVDGNTKDIMPSESHDGIKLREFGSFKVSEIELSEDYTCVRTHGSNPKVTHIFGDRVLECQNGEVTVFKEKFGDGHKIPEAFGLSDFHASYPSSSFLKFCYLCNKPLDGEDIYMYRGEKAFCSLSCRSEEIELDEKMEKTSDDTFKTANADASPNGSEIITSKAGLFIAT
ncbi:Protein of unknown function (DUF581 [Striga hermonthica]|uniref:FLZ-type domain-containing protein n=1 Tax=Striga hermonthica TaxID=68872 RepID=A0A9N7MHQ9_STRHE|nr:Protein of unknown function (DUF581 [Striga hermonthica]